MITRPVMLGDVADTCLGKMLDQRKNKGEFQPYLANINVRWGGFDLENLPQMRFAENEEERYGLRYGDILVCEGGEPGRCAIWKEELPNMKFQKALHRVRVHEDEVDCYWLFYRFLLARARGEFDQYFSGTTTIKHMPGDKLVKIRLDLPELSTQKRIGEILSAYDALIETNQRQIKLLEEAAQRLYKEWFVDLRYPGHEDVPVVDGVPDGWQKKKVTNLLQIKYGKDHKTLEDGDIPVYGSGGVMRKVKPILYSGESVLIPRKGSLNNIIFADGDFWTIDTMFYSVPQMENIAKYCYLFLSRLDMYSFNIGAAVPSMTVNILDGIDILLPDKETLLRFEQMVSNLFNQMKLLRKQNEYAGEARDRLLPKLMSGEITV